MSPPTPPTPPHSEAATPELEPLFPPSPSPPPALALDDAELDDADYDSALRLGRRAPRSPAGTEAASPASLGLSPSGWAGPPHPRSESARPRDLDAEGRGASDAGSEPDADEPLSDEAGGVDPSADPSADPPSGADSRASSATF